MLRVLLFWVLGAMAPLAAGAQQVEIAHRWGVTRIEHPPKRIVTLSFNGADNWLAIGVRPVAYRVWYGGDDTGLWPWAAGRIGNGIQLRGEIDMEAVARLEPDLIEAMYSGLTEAQYRSLSRFAPVLPPLPGVSDFGHDWAEMLTTFGRAAGRQEQAAAVVADLRARIARGAAPQWAGKTATLALAQGPMVLFPRDPRMKLLSDLGFRPPDALRALDLGGFYAALDPETIAPLDADLLLWLDFGGGVGPVLDHPMRSVMPAARQGRELVAPPDVSAALSYGSALSLEHALTWLTAAIPAALDGDPRTPAPSAQAAGLTADTGTGAGE
ncbi:ABC transporter substrate-binding protein [Actibacterium ureilyticum]|uniref:ABC transporter substrate-binding protein n=1 Tax=Actibacterium ureilyticum TaxID=1590614 RepID=UPI000BAB0343|nr:ABC transporter substrate-binding protein [Actibacterium ureilyticum]